MSLLLFATAPGVALSAPVNIRAPFITGTAQQGTTLTADPGTWIGNPTPTLVSIVWQSSANGTTGWAQVFGNSTTYQPAAGDVGNYLRVQVTETNTAPGGSAVVANSTAVGPVIGPTVLLPFDHATNGLGSAWSVIFDEEFSSSLDHTVWTPYWFANLTAIPGGTIPGDSANVTVSAGQAHLKYDGSRGALISTNPNDGVSSHVGFQFTYGYVEASVTLPDNGSGLIAQWPACWTDGQNWPFTGEIDYMEGLGGHNWLHYHYGPVGGPEITPAPGGENDVAPGAHIFGVNWQAGRLDFYVDGSLVRTIQNSDLAAGYAITSSPQYLVADYQAGTSGGTPPVTIDIDYVRAWQAIITPAAPVNTAVPVVTGTPQQAIPLSTTTGTWTGTPAPTYAYQWQSSANGTTGWANITGAINSIYTPVAGDASKYLRSTVTATNGSGNATANSTAVGPVVGQAAPVVSVAPFITGSVVVGALLTGNAGAADGTPNPVATVMQWQSSPNGTTSWTNLAMTGVLYTPVIGDVGHYLRIQQTWTNAAGTTLGTSAAVGPVTTAPAPPAPITPPPAP